MLFKSCFAIKKQLCLVLFISGITFLYAQNIKFEHYNDNSGLSHNSVRHIVQDNNGFLWLGTFSGLNRFDGYEFKSYLSSFSNENSLNDDDITALEFDSDSNNLWIGTRNGLTKLDIETHNFETFLPEKNNPNSITDHEIRSVLVDRMKSVWVGTKTKGLFRFYPESKKFKKIPLEGFEYIKEIFEDKKGNIWIGSYEKRSIAKLSFDNYGKIDQTITYSLSIPFSNEKNPYIYFIYEDHKSDIFVGTRSGLYKLDKENDVFENLYIDDSYTRDQVGPYFVSIARSPEGRYWLGTLGGLLVCDQLEDIAKGKFEWHYTILSDDTSLVDNLISSLYFDTSDVLWIGTEDGLDKYDPYENQFKLNKGISEHIDNQAPGIRGFSKTFDEKLIVATRHNGLFLFDDDLITPLYNKTSDIASIYSTDGRIFYCGLWNGEVLVYNYVTKETDIVDVGFKSSPVLTFKSIDQNRMAIGSFGEGAILLNKKSLRPIPDTSKIAEGSSINKIAFDKENKKLWFATEDGVVTYDISTKSTTIYQSNTEDKESLPHNNVSDVLIDTDNKVWAATRMGLSTFKPELNNFVAIKEPKELIGKWITDMVMDTNGNLWLNMNNSIGRLKPSSGALNVYHVKSGNRLDVFSSSGFYHIAGSKIFLGGKNGVIHFSPYTIKENQWSPKPFISEFKVQNKTVYPAMEINGQTVLDKDLNFQREVTLKYNNRNFSIQFSNPSYSNERLNQFEYMLEGFDENWISANNSSRTVQYTNLYPDNYTFKVRSSNSNGYWGETASFNIRVLPPFWFTYKAFFLFILIIALLIFLGKKELKNRMKLKQALLLEKLKQERNEKLNNEKFRFFTNISHELRTPLTLILGPAKDLLKQAGKTQNEYQETRAKLIHHNANRLLNLVTQILDFRKAQTGELQLKVSKIDILEQSKSIFESFKELAKNKNISFNFNCENETISGWIDKDKLDKILYNLLSNALKFSNNHGNVDLFLGLSDDMAEHLIIEVSDDGIGIPEASQKNIFSRFYQARNSKESTTGSGIGLSLVKSLVELHKGSIAFKSKSGEGTIFTIKVPISRKFYEDFEINELLPYQITKEVQVVKPKKKILNSVNLKQKIVVIEDNTELRNYLIDYLSDYYKVYSAENGEEGLRLCKQIKPIICVADVMMPVMDGLEFCAALKSDEFISHIPVILLTALSENEDKVKGFNVGADGYLVKPFDPSLLRTRIVNIITTRMGLKSKFSVEAESEISLLTHSPIDEKFMQKVTQLIDKNLKETDLTTAFLCAELGMSSSKLYRKIKELTDLAPNEFIRTVRLKKSAILLKTKKYNVSEVTTLVGFNDPLYFSRCFKRQFGYPPSKLIKDEVRVDII
nr:two-component regulator propeller domain-containing protein [uncultured Allomuricauda sp.]